MNKKPFWFLESSLILRGDDWFETQRLSGVIYPVWIAEHGSRKQYHVCFPGIDDFCCLMGLCDEAYSPCPNACLGLDALCKRDLVAWAHENLRAQSQATRRCFD